jgi:hypothetical protein
MTWPQRSSSKSKSKEGRRSAGPLYFFIVYLGFYNALNRADIDALRGIVVTYALHTFDRVDNENRIALADRLDRASRLAGATANAIVQNLHCHDFFSLSFFAQTENDYTARLKQARRYQQLC